MTDRALRESELSASERHAAMTQRRCNERPVSEQEFMTIAKIVI